MRVCGTDTHIYHGAMDARVKLPQVIGHEMSGTVAEIGANVTGFDIGDPVVVRPLDNRAEKESDRGHSHICRDLKFIGIDSPGAFQNSWTVPAGRWGQPEDFKGPVVFLASDAANYVHGTTLLVDGGWMGR